MKKQEARVLAVVLFFTILAIYGLLEANLIEVVELVFYDEDIPQEFNNLKIVFISDIHCSRHNTPERLKHLTAEVNKQKPDIILMAGDYVESGMEDLEGCFKSLSNMHAPLGVYGVLGNHDHFGGRAEATYRNMIKAGIQPLDNNVTWIHKGNAKIKIGGVGDLWHDFQDIDPTLENVGEQDFIILLSHNPDYAEELDTDLIDLMLSGHTHGGQINLLGLWAPYSNSRYGQKYVKGLTEARNSLKVYVTRGVGTTVVPVRLFSKPEITVITLKTKESR